MTNAETLRHEAAERRKRADGCAILAAERGDEFGTDFWAKCAARCRDEAAALDAGARALTTLAMAGGEQEIGVWTLESADGRWRAWSEEHPIFAATEAEARHALGCRLLKTALALLDENAATAAGVKP